MKKKQAIPSAFENALNDLGFGNTENQGEVTNMDTQDEFVDVEPIDDDNPVHTTTTEDENKTAKNQDSTSVDDTDIPQEVLDRMNGQQVNKESNETDDATEIQGDDIIEAQQVSALFDAIGESFGWNLDEIDDDTKPVTVDGLTAYIRDLVDQNSVPEYADERIQALDEYVKNGGKFEDFYSAQQQ